MGCEVLLEHSDCIRARTMTWNLVWTRHRTIPQKGFKLSDGRLNHTLNIKSFYDTHLDVIRQPRFEEGGRGHQAQAVRWFDKLHCSKLGLLSNTTWETKSAPQIKYLSISKNRAKSSDPCSPVLSSTSTAMYRYFPSRLLRSFGPLYSDRTFCILTFTSTSPAEDNWKRHTQTPLSKKHNRYELHDENHLEEDRQ